MRGWLELAKILLFIQTGKNLRNLTQLSILGWSLLAISSQLI
jgi:hypothetical protein